ncbi:hypothetical protein [Bordetella bronchiseptica]|uniref:hypothetical protein n=1 Tax=Bordetella bronchiseptica TaxID=518 RepID=UPI0004619677|nr:hypothetical protein [Bordetella bronchiseptica]KDB79828.1 putative lipoprotein [Bordetella bronchiseptica CARE970018BB]KDC96352.1 putative lipoprotein [Bordetella bronchiseptica MBORD670]KDD13862.1 putative lipoprotein [Bordetella bronchiseptica MBORD731]KDD25461.1 putative lipoprotein [Bordetella bronchiseptica MBORD785]KDD30467.1 putative lipoprotein [Bordetella bronchiseptica MBORD849]
MISTLFRFMLKKRVRILWQAGCAALLLAACSPSYNWREIDVADGRVRAAFPGRVQTDTRDLTLAEVPLRFSLTSARVEQAVFAIGHAPLPPEVAADPARRRALGEALARSLYANLGVQPPDPLPAPGADIEIHAPPGERDDWLLARVWATDDMLIEAVAAGTRQTLPAERAREFIDAVELRR